MPVTLVCQDSIHVYVSRPPGGQDQRPCFLLPLQLLMLTISCRVDISSQGLGWSWGLCLPTVKCWTID